MQSKDFIFEIARDMNKEPEDFQKFVDILEDNLLDTVESLNEVSDKQWEQFSFPIGLLNQIKSRLNTMNNDIRDKEIPENMSEEPETKQIDTMMGNTEHQGTAEAKNKQPVLVLPNTG